MAPQRRATASRGRYYWVHDAVVHVVPLPYERRDHQPVRILHASIRTRYLVLDGLLEPPRRAKGDERDDVVLDVPLHVHAQEGEHRVQHGCARHKTAIVGVLREPRVLE